jgi:pyridoxal phosphate enzyme (YggS family)
VIAERLEAVRARIRRAAESSGRDAGSITLVGVTKGIDVERAREGIALGISDLGENRVQELLEKQAAIDADVRWHMIGTLQRNKVHHVVGRVSLIHSVDSRRLAEAIGARAAIEGLTQDVLIQVNASHESSKHGVGPDEALEVARATAGIDGVRVRGFMTIAALGDEQRARDAFRALRDLRDKAISEVPDAVELSMGMSDDFDVAIEEGATIVRVGTAIFGPRDVAGKA